MKYSDSINQWIKNNRLLLIHLHTKKLRTTLEVDTSNECNETWSHQSGFIVNQQDGMSPVSGPYFQR